MKLVQIYGTIIIFLSIILIIQSGTIESFIIGIVGFILVLSLFPPLPSENFDSKMLFLQLLLGFWLIFMMVIFISGEIMLGKHYYSIWGVIVGICAISVLYNRRKLIKSYQKPI